jgi:alkylation response protein AidB-like acyl-CoA dehydrogenase
VAALTASDADGRRTDEALSSLLEGTDTAAWVDGASSAGGVIDRRRSDDVVLDGAVAPVEVAIDAGYLVISCSDSTTYLVPSSTPGVTITALHSLDGSRSYGRVRCERVLIRPDTLLGRGPDPALVSHLRDLAVIIQLGEIVGAMEWAFESTTRWCFDRYSFGQPLAAYQAIQHRLADLAMGLEASRAITADAALAMLGDGFDRTELVSAAKAYVGRVGPDLLQECVQLHGGIGLTADHDLHRYLRRVAADVATHGNVREHAARVGRLVEQRVSA